MTENEVAGLVLVLLVLGALYTYSDYSDALSEVYVDEAWVDRIDFDRLRLTLAVSICNPSDRDVDGRAEVRLVVAGLLETTSKEDTFYIEAGECDVIKVTYTFADIDALASLVNLLQSGGQVGGGWVNVEAVVDAEFNKKVFYSINAGTEEVEYRVSLVPSPFG